MTLNYPNYPKHIVGKSNFTKIDKIGFLKHRGFFVGRTTSMDASLFSNEAIIESFEAGLEIKDSTIKNGISVNLISIYKKKDMKFAPIENRNEPRFHISFEEGADGCLPQAREYTYDNAKKYYGFKVSQIQDFEILFAYKANGISPSNKIRFKIEHSPTMCNFWHFNIFLFGQDCFSGKWIKLECPKNVSNNTFKKIANAIFPFLAKKIIMSKIVRARKLNKKYFTK